MQRIRANDTFYSTKLSGVLPLTSLASVRTYWSRDVHLLGVRVLVPEFGHRYKTQRCVLR